MNDLDRWGTGLQVLDMLDAPRGRTWGAADAEVAARLQEAASAGALHPRHGSAVKVQALVLSGHP
ncbi:MAG: hypothetical protein RIC14_00945 [Filomicrobium sp.]